MKIILINPPLKNLLMAETPEFVTKDRGYNPPMGLIWIATCVNKNSYHKAKVLDTQVMEMDYDAIKRYIQQEKPDAVGIAAITFTLLDSLRVSRLVKEVDSSIKVIFGGPHATLYPCETLNLEAVDYVIAGEGEFAFPALLDTLEGGKGMEKVPGVFYKEEGKARRGVAPRIIKDLDVLPIPDRTLTPHRKYSSVLAHTNPFTTSVGTRGCPFRCTFCDRPQMGGKSYRARSPQLIVDEMENCHELGIREIMFYDDTWTMIMPRAKEICEDILTRGLDITWSCRTRVDKVSPELVRLMQKAGCRRINFGVESGTEEGLISIKKQCTLQQVRDAFEMCRLVNMETLGYFMIGLPGETREQMLETIRFTKSVKPNFLHFTVLTPFPETQIWRDLIKNGDRRAEKAWHDYAKNPSGAFDPPTANEYITKEELFEICTAGYKEFYFRPKYMLKEFLKMRSPGEFLRKAKAGLKVFVAK